MGRTVARILAALAVVAALVASLLVGRQPGGPLVVSGLLESDQIRVGSRVGGRVAEVLVREGDAVEPGEVLVRLEPFDIEERVSAARAELEARRSRADVLEAGARAQEIAVARARRDQAKARLEELKAGAREQQVHVAREAVKLAEAEFELATTEKERATRLVETGAAPAEDLDVKVSRWKVAAASLAARRAELALLEEGTRAEVIAQAEAQLRQAEEQLSLVEAGPREEEIAQAKHEAEAAAATVAALERARAELEVRAPRASEVEALDLEPGDLVSPNAPVLSLRDRSRLRVRAYVPEPHLRLVAEGTELPVRVDGFDPLRPFRGTVTFVEGQAEFAPGNVQTPEERHELVFRIRVALDMSDPRARELRAGMHADVVLAEERP